jgi:uncharacterized membrane protein YjgN (DUF898 family)
MTSLPSRIDDDAAGQVARAQTLERLTFHGSGSEYFRIWIVNLLLTIATLGIYSAWAKVRKTRYFYGSTRLAGAGFDYHGKPLAILKGRAIAVACIAGYNLMLNFSVVPGAIIGVLMMLVLPWLFWKSLQFRLYNSSYRGIRFGFRGSPGLAYLAFLLYPIMTFFSLYLLAPLAHREIKKFQHEESRFGNTWFSFHATIGGFYKAYLVGFLIMVGGIILLGIGFASTLSGLALTGGVKHVAASRAGAVILFIFCLYVWLFSIYPIFLTMIQNLVWNNTRLGPHRFESNLKWGRMSFITITNLLAIVLTLGLFIPFAAVRSMKYRIESMTLLPAASLDDFIALEQDEASAAGEGMADLLDFDLSL